MGIGGGQQSGKALIGAVALAGASLTAASALAQTAPPPPSATQQVAPSREELNPDERRTVRPAPRNTDPFSPPTALPCPLASSTVTFKLEGVDIVGATVDPRDLQRAYKDYVGTTVPVSKICDIRDNLSLILFRKGLLARVEVPEQTIAGGRLKLEVTEARIVAVRVHGDIGPGQDRVEAYLERLRGLTPFDLNTAQRYLLLANDVPGVRVTAALRPSAEGRGALDLDVQLQRQAVQFLAAAQNTGSDALGPWSGLGRVDLNSFTRFGERTTLIGYHTIDKEQWIVQAVEEARIGSSGLLARASFAYGQSRPGGLLKPLQLRGESIVGTAEVRYPLIKLRRYSVTLSGGMDFIDQTTSFPGGDKLADDSLRILWTKASGEFVHPFGEDWSATGNGELEVRKGLSALGASKTGDPTLSRVQGKPDAWVVRLTGDAHLTYRWADAELRTEAQYANEPLLSYEEQALGDLTIGRGYEPAVLSGDRAAAAELKLEFLAPPIRDKVVLRPFVFFDVGHIDNLDAGSQPRTLRSAGAGVDWRLPFGLRGFLLWADPLDKPFPTSPTKPGQRVLFQLVWSR